MYDLNTPKSCGVWDVLLSVDFGEDTREKVWQSRVWCGKAWSGVERDGVFLVCCVARLAVAGCVGEAGVGQFHRSIEPQYS